jgi:Putative MetA-pathway of phenol degradation
LGDTIRRRAGYFFGGLHLAAILSLIGGALLFSGIARAQESPEPVSGSAGGASAQQNTDSAAQADIPQANPGRPTVSTPATLTPVGYLQFETGVLAAWDSPEFSSQTSFGEVVKFAVAPRLQLLVSSQPFAHSNTQPTNGTGDLTLGAQGVVHEGEGANPTIALSYFGRVYSGDAPDLDMGSASNSALLLISADVKGFHYDTNYLFNEQAGDSGTRRAQFGQTLSVSHALTGKFGLSGEIWRFTQPFLRGNAVGNLWAVNYNAKRNLVFDAAFNRGLTSTSTRWEILAGFTYLLPHRLHWR